MAEKLPTLSGEQQMILALAGLMIGVGLAFKLSAVPFHFYAPDVYEGTSAFNAGILAVVPKAAGLFALFRLIGQVTIGFEATGQQLTLILAAVTMTGGNCLALLQSNIRRMLAYSSVAHAGYMLLSSHRKRSAAETDALEAEARLRDAATMSGDVDVLGQVNYLDVWNHDRFVAKMQREPFTDDDARALAEFGI